MLFAKKSAICLLYLLVVLAVALVGCSNGDGGAVIDTATSTATTERYPDAGDDDFLDGDSDKTEEEKDVAEEALNYAQESNTGSTFKVVEVKTAEGWARVAVEEVGVPMEEAVGFSLYLRKLDGDWEVIDTGDDLSPEDIPDAPLQIFKS